MSVDTPDFAAAERLSDTEFFGVGSAKASNPTLAMQTADTRAKQDIADTLSLLAGELLADYARKTEGPSGEAAFRLSGTIGTQITGSTLLGVKVDRRQQTKDGTWWALASCPKDAARRLLAGIFEKTAASDRDFKWRDVLRTWDELYKKDAVN
jgi:hypothetical protein